MGTRVDILRTMVEILKQTVALVAAFQGVLGVIVGAVVTYLTTKLTERRSDQRQAIQLKAADQARRYEIGRTDALKAITLIDALLATVDNPDNPSNPSAIGGVLIFDEVRANKLKNRIERLPDNATARRGMWLIRVAIEPREFAPENHPSFKFLQKQALAYLRDDMARFARGSEKVSKAAADLSKSIEDHYWALFELPGRPRAEPAPPR